MAEDVKNIHVTDEMLNQATQNYMKSLEGPEQLQIKLLKENAEEVYKGIMSIPLYPRLTNQEVHDVIHAVKKVVENYRK